MAYSTVKGLNAVEKLLKAGWIQGSLAEDSAGVNVPVDSKDATNFCLEGCISSLKVGNRFKVSMRRQLSKAIAKKTNSNTNSIITFNDAYAKTVDDVLEIVRAARRLAQSDRARRSIRSARKNQVR